MDPTGIADLLRPLSNNVQRKLEIANTHLAQALRAPREIGGY